MTTAMCDNPVDIPPDGDPADIILADSERQRCEVWSRVMGYHRPVESWNVGKKREHADRKFYNTAQTVAQLS